MFGENLTMDVIGYFEGMSGGTVAAIDTPRQLAIVKDYMDYEGQLLGFNTVEIRGDYKEVRKIEEKDYIEFWKEKMKRCEGRTVVGDLL